MSLAAAALGAWAQYFYKVGAIKIDTIGILKNYWLLGGLISFSAVLILFIFAFRMGGKMFVIYPVYATTYIWGGIIAYYLAKESVNSWQIIGTALIVIGVCVISFGHQVE